MGVNKSPSASLKKPGSKSEKPVPKSSVRKGEKASAKTNLLKTKGPKSELRPESKKPEVKKEVKKSDAKLPLAKGKVHLAKPKGPEPEKLQVSQKSGKTLVKGVIGSKARNLGQDPKPQDLRLKKGGAPARHEQPNSQRGADARAALEKLNRASGKSKVISSTVVKDQIGHGGKQKAAFGLGARIEAAAETVCREVACEGLATTGGYCRLHYIKNWKKIKRKEIILREKKLNQYIEELVAKYPDKYIEAIRQDLASDKDFAKVIYDLDLDEGVDDFDADNAESADALIDTIKREFDDEGDVF